MSETKMNVGGQAVLEGVMMRSPNCFAVVVRRKNGDIVVREEPWKGKWSHKLGKIPFVRGAVTLVESLSNGYQALRFSAEQMEADLNAEQDAGEATSDAADPSLSQAQEEVRKEFGEDPPAAREAAAASSQSSDASGVGSRIAMLFAIGLFIALPQLLALLLKPLFGPGFDLQSFWFHAVTGVFKLGIILTYLSLIRRVPDIRRVFQYHGAEHKAIATYEAKQELTVENARRFSTRHARCGTTFLIVVVLVSVIFHAALLPPLLHGLTGALAQVTAIVLKVLMLPIIAGAAYELQRFSARFTENPIARVFLTPGYWVQGITTIEPSDDQLEVALASLRVTLARENAHRAGSAPVAEPVVRTFPTYDALSAGMAV